MEQHSERPEIRSDQEPQIQGLGDAGESAAEGGVGADEYADAEESTGAVAWDVEDEDVVAWDSGQAAGGAVMAPDEREQRPATGEPRVDAALARLDELSGRPVAEHRAIFEDVHRRLRDVLGELDTREQDSGDQPAGAGAERRAGR
jgi:hypothetical protein